jgi:hypothetical protein
MMWVNWKKVFKAGARFRAAYKYYRFYEKKFKQEQHARLKLEEAYIYQCSLTDLYRYTPEIVKGGPCDRCVVVRTSEPDEIFDGL